MHTTPWHDSCGTAAAVHRHTLPPLSRPAHCHGKVPSRKGFRELRELRELRLRVLRHEAQARALLRGPEEEVRQRRDVRPERRVRVRLGTRTPDPDTGEGLLKIPRTGKNGTAKNLRNTMKLVGRM